MLSQNQTTKKTKQQNQYVETTLQTFNLVISWIGDLQQILSSRLGSVVASRSPCQSCREDGTPLTLGSAKLGILNALSIYSIFNPQWVYLHVTPPLGQEGLYTHAQEK
jgi:hypothetical protein